MKRLLLIIVLIFAINSTSKLNANFLHPFYVSVTEMNFNPKTNNLEISCKLFVDDLQLALIKNYKRQIDLLNTKQEADNSKFLNDYLSKHLAINVDSKIAGIKFIGFEVESESIYCYFEATNIPSPQKVVITNNILQDYKDEQVNIMHVVVKGNRKSAKTDNKSSQATLTF